jgi:hypothetical protein
MLTHQAEEYRSEYVKIGKASNHGKNLGYLEGEAKTETLRPQDLV